MKKLMLILFLAIVTASLAMAGAAGTIPTVTNQNTDILGAHLLYGRGCPGCHAPHSGAGGNGITKDANAWNGNYALWGQDLVPLYGQTVTFGDPGSGTSSYTVTLPAAGTITSAHDANTVILFCLSCHDGNFTKGAMMVGHTVETIPVVGGVAPTLLGNDGSGAGNYNNDHPVGANALVSCGGTYNWDCTGGNGANISMTGPNSAQFVLNYGYAVSLSSFGGVAYNTAVTCTSCHNQHSQNVYFGKMQGLSTPQPYQTMFFLRGYYNPTTGGNSAAQFCRQCHGGESNEMAGQWGVPTT